MRSAGSCSSERDLDSDIDEEDEGTDQPLSASHVGEGLAEVPAHLASLTRLQALCLHGNSICRIDHLGGLSRLRDLNLSSNCIEAVGSGLRGLVRLTSLNLSSNNLSTVEGLEGLLELRRLNLSHNYVRSLQVGSDLQLKAMLGMHCALAVVRAHFGVHHQIWLVALSRERSKHIRFKCCLAGPYCAPWQSAAVPGHAKQCPRLPA